MASNGIWIPTEMESGTQVQIWLTTSDRPAGFPLSETGITDGITKIGVTNGQQWYLDTNGNGTWDAGSDMAYNFGSPGWIPVVGDWNNNGITKIGVTNGQHGIWIPTEMGHGKQGQIWLTISDRPGGHR